ncbi:MAG: hypothetical protein ACRD3L_10665 [Terriglobales bacterium]
MKIRGLMLFSLAMLCLCALVPLALAQSSAAPGNSSGASVPPATPQPSIAYTRPSDKVKFHNYLFDAFGPYPILGAAIAAGINQSSNSPPEWMQGGEGYGKRFGSNFGIAAISTTTRYALAEVFRQDTLYYPCECKGFGPRLGHALISTLTARSGDDGHRVFSVPALVAPYAGTLTAVYAWYPDRFDGRDAFRMGNYVMLGYAGVNIATEFLFSGPHSLGSRLHVHAPHSAPSSEK